jgi:hypothetical protein
MRLDSDGNLHHTQQQNNTSEHLRVHHRDDDDDVEHVDRQTDLSGTWMMPDAWRVDVHDHMAHDNHMAHIDMPSDVNTDGMMMPVMRGFHAQNLQKNEYGDVDMLYEHVPTKVRTHGPADYYNAWRPAVWRPEHPTPRNGLHGQSKGLRWRGPVTPSNDSESARNRLVGTDHNGLVRNGSQQRCGPVYVDKLRESGQNLGWGWGEPDLMRGDMLRALRAGWDGVPVTVEEGKRCVCVCMSLCMYACI